MLSELGPPGREIRTADHADVRSLGDRRSAPHGKPMKCWHLWLIPVCLAFGYVCALLVAPGFGVLCTVCSFSLRWRFTGAAWTRWSRSIPLHPASSRIASDQTVILGNTSQIRTLAGESMNPAKDGCPDFAPARQHLSFPRACLARARNPEFAAGQRTGILRAAATRENDQQGILHDQNCHRAQ